MTRGATLASAALLCALAACGPYGDVAQKLDVSATIADADAWIALDGGTARLLLLGKPAHAGEKAAFVLTTMDLSIAAGIAASTIEGVYSEDASGAALHFTEQLLYTLPDERSVALLSRHGVRRADVDVSLSVAETRTSASLAIAADAAVAGSQAFAGSYARMADALAHLGSAASSDAVCAFQAANLAIRSSEIRILYFGSAAMTQYGTTATFGGVLSGAMTVHADISVPSFDSDTTIGYAQFADFAGVHVDGQQVTKADGSGDSKMSGVVRFSLDAGAGRTLAGGIDYGGADPVIISSGNPSGGHYSVTIDGGGSAQIAPAQPASPTLRQCFGL